MGGSGLYGWYVAWTCSHSKVGQKVKEDLAYWAETRRLAMNVLSKKTCEPSGERRWPHLVRAVPLWSPYARQPTKWGKEAGNS